MVGVVTRFHRPSRAQPPGRGDDERGKMEGMTNASNQDVGPAIPDAVKLLEQRIKQLADSGFLTGHKALGPAIQRAATGDRARPSYPLRTAH